MLGLVCHLPNQLQASGREGPAGRMDGLVISAITQWEGLGLGLGHTHSPNYDYLGTDLWITLTQKTDQHISAFLTLLHLCSLNYNI